ncbi:hypothetical protein [Parasphingopyxis marina]|uniref:Uncharacterized protein n=1 Tax=Parasphingopyxis marina TaxID=2761622 RepID=A0A842I293_9SPHN|nr:hypothetical protein [Parasphingopyxis marina]MBC2779107.1 hypothetical protein [Parasphingopyxis marina]
MVIRVVFAASLALCAAPSLAEQALPYDTTGLGGAAAPEPRLVYRLGAITGEHVTGPSSLEYAGLARLISATSFTASDGWRLGYDLDPLLYVIVADAGGRPAAAAP